MGGVTEVAEILGVSRQRISKLRDRADFPDPIAEIAQGPIWNLDEIDAWGGSSLRSSSGRPRADTAARTLGGRFVLEEPRIGHGGFADVYRALDRKQTGRDATPVAVKVLRDVSDVEPEAVRRFERELRLLESIRHPNIVPILGHGLTATGGIWYAMPLAQGSLVEFTEKLYGKNALILDLMRQVGAGLTHIHSKGIYHRDLKPGNILRFEDGVWAIADFGLAVEAERKTTALTSSRRGIGTTWYTAPEQWRDARSVDHLADVFSLAKVLQELIVGDTPITNEIPPGPLRPIVQKATANQAEYRYATIRDFLEALETAIEAPEEKWEAAEDTAQRLLERVRLPKAAEADLDELATWALALDENDSDDMTALARVLPWISTRSIRYLWTSDPPAFQMIFRHYSNHIETHNFTFDYCDVLANFSRKAVKETDDSDVLREAIRSLVVLGRDHNRWHVRDVVTTILQSIRMPEPALAAVEALRVADIEAVEWTLSDFSIRSLPPILRRGIDELLSTPMR
ncbi:serine/threonine-protein kinase [Frankia sp. CiP3]|uniref:serine/threonine-protein kinase n=1 Tax=Frankia sp. CiP3 TaxID=2880971 RepID=UPI001EF57D50|nr:serine/threonine-protein kinase [Frankia sp. CiP3]